MRDGVIIVFFDLPVKSNTEKKAYRDFRNYLLREGYRSLQKSVYFKYLRNMSMADYYIKDLEVNSPQTGEIFTLCSNYKCFKSMYAISGELPDFDKISSPVIIL